MKTLAPLHPAYSTQPVATWKMLLLVFSSVIGLATCYLVMESPQLDTDWSIKVSVVSLITLSGFFLFSLLIFKTPYLFTNAYLLALSLFHLGITIPESFGLMEVAGWHSGSFAKWLEQAGWYTVLALACIGVGFSLSVTPSRIASLHQQVDLETKNRSLSKAFRDGVGLLLVSGVMFGLAIASFGYLLAYSRVDFFRGVGDTRGLGVFLITFPSAITLLVIGAQTRCQHLFAWALFCFGTALILLSGYRTFALYPILIGAIVWVKIGRRIPIVYAVSSVVVIILAISTIGILRSYKYQEMDSKKLVQSIESANSTDTFQTLGQTGGILAHILRLVPQTDPYRYGETFAQYILASIPNLTMTMSESDRTIVLRESLKDPTAIRRVMPADWLTYRLIPQIFAKGEGVGFSGIGEPYLNFGLPGVLIFFILLGYFMGRIEQMNLFQHPAMLVFTAAVLWHFVKTVRDDFGNFIKPMIFIYIILFIWRFLSERFFRFPPKQSKILHTGAHEQLEIK